MDDAELDPHAQALVSLIVKQEPEAVFWTKHYWANDRTYAVEVILLDGAERAEGA